jgi:DNA mismatch repair protein MutL
MAVFAAMGKIVKLSDKVINQIAAGEVVERPVAVVKELVENALDAGSQRIEIEFRKGGKSLIRVTDDGCGMSPEDAQLALERHATSKIRDFNDLLMVSSFGFRGEALPSIASVSRFTLRTRPQNEAEGTEIVAENGHLRAPGACGMPPGTSIEVAQLFNTVPARRKFLKTDRTESAHIIQMCRLLAVANWKVAFTLIEDGRILFQSPPAPNLAHRIREIWGKQLADILMPIDYREGDFQLSGLIGKPTFGARATRADMNAFVNKRPVDSRLLHYALIESYHTYIPKGRYPVAFLFLEMPAAGLDVNVHPAKREVRFRDEGNLRRFVMEGVIDHLRNASQTRLKNMQPVKEIVETDSATIPSIPQPVLPANSPILSSIPLGDGANSISQSRSAPAPAQVAGSKDVPVPSQVGTANPVEASQNSVDPGAASSLTGWRYLGRAQQRYWLFDSPGGIILLHLGAAYQRLHYERILKSLEQQQAQSQDLMFPATMELDPISCRLLDDHSEWFQQRGFGIEPFGRNLYRLRSVPEWFEPAEGETFLRDFLQLLEERGWKKHDENAMQDKIARLAAKKLSRHKPSSIGEEPLDLLARLLACSEPLRDPEGRPTFIELKASDLARRFGI